MTAIAMAALSARAQAEVAAATTIQPPPSEDRSRAIMCMTAAIAYEAALEPVEGQQAVAQVILNRLRSPLFPKTVCGVVFAGSDRSTGCQFSFTCDGSLRRQLSSHTLYAARAVAEAVLDGSVPDHVAGATHYHASYVSPYWAPSLVRIAKIGAHIFYRLPGAGDDVQTAARFIPAAEPVIPAMTRLAGLAWSGDISRRTTVAPAPAPAFAPWGIAASASTAP